MELISHTEPLLDYLGRRAFAVGLTLLVEVPGAFSLHVLVAGVDYARRIGIVLAEVLGGIVEHLLLVDAVSLFASKTILWDVFLRVRFAYFTCIAFLV